MDTSIVPALAGLTGAAIGGLTSGIASWFAQKTQSRVQLLAQDKVPRQELYKEFIEAATQCYADALQHEKPDIPGLVNLYGKIGRMRVLSSPRVLASAEQIGQKIINMYLEPNKTFFELREMVNKNAIDILGNFGEACREEFRSLHMFESWPIGGGHRKKYVTASVGSLMLLRLWVRLRLLAQSRHRDRGEGCPLAGVKRTLQFQSGMSAVDP